MIHRAAVLLLLPLLAGCAVVPVPVPVPSGAPRPPAGPAPSPAPAPASIAEMERQTHDQINRYRASRGLAPLRYSDALAAIARRHSEEMAAGRVPFGHTGFEQRAQQALAAGIDYRSIAENVHSNTYLAGSAVATAVSGWIGSPAHLENIVGAYDLTGVGIARSARGGWYFTQVFVGSRQRPSRSR